MIIWAFLLPQFQRQSPRPDEVEIILDILQVRMHLRQRLPTYVHKDRDVRQGNRDHKGGVLC